MATREETSDSDSDTEQLAAYLPPKRYSQGKQSRQPLPNRRHTQQRKEDHRHGQKSQQPNINIKPCHYHTRFGDNAYRCTQACNYFSKNGHQGYSNHL